MQTTFLQVVRHGVTVCVMLCMMVFAGVAQAAPYAAMVMDARNGEVIFARNHDTQLHPASLTKMMTIYVAFEAIKHGEVSLDTQFTVSRRATQATCVCLGLREGQRISLRYLIRASALRSANDAAIVIAEGISGSVEEFAQRMTRTARAMGMNNTTFRNPHGLTQTGHVSTARDMTILGRQLYFDYPQYFNIFSRRSDHAGVGTVPNTNRRFLDAYSGADGIKTGYTRAAGFNLTASAKRGEKHIIATMFGGSTAAARNAHVAELMDIGFNRAATRVASRAPRTPDYQGPAGTAVAQASGSQPRNGDDDPRGAAKTIRLQLAVRTSPRPMARGQAQPDALPDEELMLAVQQSVDDTAAEELAEAVSESVAAVDETDRAPEALAVLPRARPDEAEASGLGSSADEAELAAAIEAGFTLADPDDLAALEDDDSAPHTPAEDMTEDAGPMVVAEVVEVMEALTETDITEDRSAPIIVAAPGTESPAIPPMRPEALATASPDPSPEQPALAEAAPARPEALDEAISDVTLASAEQPGTVTDTIWAGAETTFLKDQDAQRSLMDAAISLTMNAGPNQPAADPRPAPNPDIILTSTPSSGTPQAAPQGSTQHAAETELAETEMVSRLSTSDSGRTWGVSLGQFPSRHAAERGLIAVKMAEAGALGNGVSRIRQTSGRFEASFAGLTQSEAERACLRLSARSMDCSIAHP
jgi:D-alanyl-D-alanine carboxypeptidase